MRLALRGGLTKDERAFLLSLKTGEPQWDLLGISNVEQLPGVQFSNYRTEHGAEVDLIVERTDGETIAVECKSGNTVGSTVLEGFKSFASFFKRPHRKIVIYGGTTPRRIAEVDILPFQNGIREIFR